MGLKKTNEKGKMKKGRKWGLGLCDNLRNLGERKISAYLTSF